MKEIFAKHREIILYIFFGGLTTLVSAVFYFLASWVFDAPAWLSSIISWIFAVCFAFVTNKLFVFESKEKKGTTKEAALFFAARLASLFINTAIMFVFVDLMEFNEPIIFVAGQLVVLIFNYIASKFLIFKKRG
ncbi:MAG: GtrA family protein [Defluviitaleaceae bacterium]|nr:GtrA family protein [Defluviitaleaceae bacterium]